MTVSRLLSALLLLALALPARAALDPAANEPYHLHVVLGIADNRFLTPLFQERLQRELGDQLRLTFGPLARVEVVRKHELLDEIEARGLDQVLDRHEEVSERQTHFVLLDHVAGQYRLQARAYEGMTGQAGVLRQARTSDRAFVARLAARLVEENFSPVGTVTEAGKDVRLTLRGGKLGVPLERWVKPGDVFAVSRVLQEGDGQRAARLAWALLEVLEAPRDGVALCRYWNRFREDQLTAAPGVLGYRARKLPTRTGPVRLRLLDAESFRPLDGVHVRVTRPGTKKQVEVVTNRDGLAVTRETFDHFALAHVLSGGQVRAQLPVEIIDGRVAVCRIKVEGASEAVAAAEYRREAWLRRIFENARLAAERVAHLNALLGKSLEAARKEGQAGLKNLDAELDQLERERSELERLARDKQLPRFDLREGEQGLAKLRERRNDLEQFVQRVESVLKEATSAETLGLHKMLEQARLLESEAEVEQALALYAKVLQASPDQPKVQAHYDRLQEAWKTKDAKHAEARDFIYQTWPKLDLAGLQKNLGKAKEALQAVRAAEDRWSLLRLERADVVHAANLKRRLESLRRLDTEDSRNQTRTLRQVADGLRQFHADVLAALRRKE